MQSTFANKSKSKYEKEIAFVLLSTIVSSSQLDRESYIRTRNKLLVLLSACVHSQTVSYIFRILVKYSSFKSSSRRRILWSSSTARRNESFGKSLVLRGALLHRMLVSIRSSNLQENRSKLLHNSSLKWLLGRVPWTTGCDIGSGF